MSSFLPRTPKVLILLLTRGLSFCQRFCTSNGGDGRVPLPGNLNALGALATLRICTKNGDPIHQPLTAVESFTFGVGIRRVDRVRLAAPDRDDRVGDWDREGGFSVAHPATIKEHLLHEILFCRLLDTGDGYYPNHTLGLEV